MEETKPLLYEQPGYAPTLPPAQTFPGTGPGAPPAYDYSGQPQYQQQYPPAADQPQYQQQYPPPAAQPQYQQQYPPAQAPGYQQPAVVPIYHQPAPANTVVVNTNNISFGEVPIQLRCPSCGEDMITNVSYEPGMLTWIAVGVLFILGFILCCWIPLVLNALKDVNHTCSKCHYRCGVYKRLDF